MQLNSALRLTHMTDMTAIENNKTELTSTLVSRNVTISGHRTSIRLEPEMWEGLMEICRREKANLHKICSSVSLQKDENTSLTAAIRVFVMRYFRQAATEDGHIKAGHGYSLTLAMNTPKGMDRNLMQRTGLR